MIKTTTIEFKKNYTIDKKIRNSNLEKSYEIMKTLQNILKIFLYFDVVFFRNIIRKELDEVNNLLWINLA